MSIETLSPAQQLRPAAMQAKPVRLEAVFADPEEIVRKVRARAPYPTVTAHHNIGDTMDWKGSFPWFKTHVDDPAFLEVPAFVTAAKESFAAGIVRPTACAINLYGPMGSGPPHLDAPLYRGFSYRNAPIWFLMNMTYSGLFYDWMVPQASGLAWFYDGEGGEFEYWGDGAAAPPARVDAPMWNVGVMSDNEFMWHRVGPIGPKALQERLHGALRASDKLHYVGDGAWEIRDGDRIVQRLAPREVRLSMLWKAQVFRDEAHLASFEDRMLDLDLRQVVHMYLEDLRAKGLNVDRPADPFADERWRRVLQATYAPPFDSAGEYLG
jgi:hypothetical protein